MSIENIAPRQAEAEVIAHHAIAGAEPWSAALPEEDGEVIIFANPITGETQVRDLEGILHYPRRVRGTTRLFDDSSFSRFVMLHTHENVRVYADLYRFHFDAVFNDASKGVPGWADHRAVFTLKSTPEWDHWAGRNNDMMSQEEFAEHIEYGSQEVVEPSAADMLELAQTFHAKKDVAFRQATVLTSGERKFTYNEDMTASAGASGDLVIPKEFKLGIQPFEGTDKYGVTARLRYRLNGPKLSLGYKLDRPEVVQRSAFDDVLQNIADTTDTDVLAGNPPTGVANVQG